MPSSVSRRALLQATLAALAITPLPASANAAGGAAGILLLAHGTHGMGHQHDHKFRGGHTTHLPKPAETNPWEENVAAIARALDKAHPTEVAFGMADPANMQAAVTRLEERGATQIAAIPLFISSHSPIIGNFRYILGLQDKLGTRTQVTQLARVNSKATFTFSSAMDADPLISEVLYDRAKTAAKYPAKTTVVIIAHGPNDEADNALWLKDMEKHADYLKRRGFHAVSVLTHRNDAAPDVKSAARTAFRARVAAASRHGQSVVVPLLLSKGGIEAEVEGDLEGLQFTFTPPLAPHPNLVRWVEARFQALTAPPL